MAGTTTVTEKRTGTVKKITWTWLSDASGDADAGVSAAVDGQVVALATDPDGTDIPTDNYDIVLNDGDSLDVLAGAGANRDLANTEYVVAKESLGAISNEKLTLVVSNAGNAKRGKVYLWVR